MLTYIFLCIKAYSRFKRVTKEAENPIPSQAAIPTGIGQWVDFYARRKVRHKYIPIL